LLRLITITPLTRFPRSADLARCRHCPAPGARSKKEWPVAGDMDTRQVPVRVNSNRTVSMTHTNPTTANPAFAHGIEHINCPGVKVRPGQQCTKATEMCLRRDFVQITLARQFTEAEIVELLRALPAATP
jgi:hypothetical protein